MNVFSEPNDRCHRSEDTSGRIFSAIDAPHESWLAMSVAEIRTFSWLPMRSREKSCIRAAYSRCSGV